MSEYIDFVPAGWSRSNKTCVWEVMSSKSGDVLGVIRWHGPWRCYVFAPDGESGSSTIFNSGCLTSISVFCQNRTDEHFGRRKAA